MANDGNLISRLFDQIVAEGDSPVWIVTTTAARRRAGCLVGFTAQVGIEPRRFLVCLSKNNHTYRIACQADFLAVHLLAEDGMALARLFGEETTYDMDKFDHCDWSEGPHLLPILTAAPGWFVGKILQRNDFGDHVGFVLDPVAARLSRRPAHALRYQDVAELTPGTTP